MAVVAGLGSAVSASFLEWESSFSAEVAEIELLLRGASRPADERLTALRDASTTLFGARLHNELLLLLASVGNSVAQKRMYLVCCVHYALARSRAEGRVGAPPRRGDPPPTQPFRPSQPGH